MKTLEQKLTELPPDQRERIEEATASRKAAMAKPQKIYAEHLEESALDQFTEAMEQPFVLQGALMPDAHTGYTLPIGAVVACTEICPAYVGYDIGCGMCAVPTSFSKNAVINNRQAIFDLIYEKLPVGNQKHGKPYRPDYNTDGLTTVGHEVYESRKGDLQLGTLGGGNHFVEIGYDENDTVWIIIHSGSRGTGHGIASHYMARAASSDVPVEGHFALDPKSDLGKQYIQDLTWCLQYALDNRQSMIEQVGNYMAKLCNGDVTWDQLINRNHNHAELDSQGRWIHRKGATHAEDGMMGVIPGNMRDGSFIVRGKGNPDSLSSSSHGAGRVLGRYKAKKKLKVEDFEETMSGITAKVCHDTLDESPFAYKDIFEVMRLQSDLVDVVHHVKPLINIKG